MLNVCKLLAVVSK